MYLIVGLGNPGKKYEQTRHNVGFWLIDRLAEKMGIAVEKKQSGAFIGTGMYKGKKILLAKPQTYMNLSGEAVIQLLNYYDTIDELIIIHDDLDLAEGVIRFKDGGGLGGHNGLKSITQHLHSQDFERLRIGIGRPDQQKVVNYVLEPFSQEHKKAVDQALDEAADGIDVWLESGIQTAMNQYNQKKKEPKAEKQKAEKQKDETEKDETESQRDHDEESS